uniref:Uncharacterized protein n=1 Tax=Glossina pallidipes TaxID=7398 RepID=A0A1A9ZBY5_GLOPL
MKRKKRRTMEPKRNTQNKPGTRKAMQSFKGNESKCLLPKGNSKDIVRERQSDPVKSFNKPELSTSTKSYLIRLILRSNMCIVVALTISSSGVADKSPSSEASAILAILWVVGVSLLRLIIIKGQFVLYLGTHHGWDVNLRLLFDMSQSVYRIASRAYRYFEHKLKSFQGNCEEVFICIRAIYTSMAVENTSMSNTLQLTKCTHSRNHVMHVVHQLEPFDTSNIYSID